MHRNRQLELVLQLEAQLLEQLELEKRVRPEKHLNSTKHLPQTQRKSAPNLLESDGPKQVLKRARSIQSMTATKCKKKSIKLTVGTSFDHSTLGGKTKFDAVTHSVSGIPRLTNRSWGLLVGTPFWGYAKSPPSGVVFEMSPPSGACPFIYY